MTLNIKEIFREFGSRSLVGCKYLIFVLFFLFTIFPLVWMFLTSFKKRNEIFSGGLLPEEFILKNYKFVLLNLDLANNLLNTTLVTIATVVLIVAFSTMAGYAFAKINFPGNNILFLIFLASLTIPPQVTLIPLFILLKRLALLDTRVGLVFSYTGLGLAFSIFLMRSFFQTLPGSLREAALVDGASEFTIFLRIMLPLAKPGVATITIFQFVYTWNEFMYATTFINSDSLRTLQPSIRSLVGQYSTNWGALTAAMVFAVLPLLVIFLVLQRRVIEGLTAGAIKG